MRIVIAPQEFKGSLTASEAAAAMGVGAREALPAASPGRAPAAGLRRLAEDERAPRLASTYGVGELVRAALGAGCRRLIIGQGGSATNAGGAGRGRGAGVWVPGA